MAAKDKKAVNFEKAFKRLEEIVEQLNSDMVDLDDALKLYEEADTLVHACNQRLVNAEQRVETLIKNRQGALALDANGNPQTEPFALSENENGRESE